MLTNNEEIKTKVIETRMPRWMRRGVTRSIRITNVHKYTIRGSLQITVGNRQNN